MQSSYLQDRIFSFYKIRSEAIRKPLENIINVMLEKCRYVNGESLERHNWGNNPIKLKNIPKNKDLPSFEEDLINALELEENEKSNVELLWGDIQIGKRVHACIIMWFSVYILKRPVLYIFRNLSIDQKQLQDDIVGTEKYNFNIQFIKNHFEEFNGVIQEHCNETNVDYWKDYKLPELKEISGKKLSNKDAINSNDIICCLMNHIQLEKINKEFSEYIYYNDELVNMTVLVDESDLMGPTSSNDRTNVNDKKDSTLCEILLAKIYKKVKYALHITGTAHSLLYNVTSRLSDNTNIQIKISKVHKMKRPNDYYGLFNHGSINFNTHVVKPWWKPEDNKKICYDIVEDYNVNIKEIIKQIIERPTVKYNSLLISEEKIRANQFTLIDRILKDFSELFIVIYHGNCLRLYLPKKYEEEIKKLSKWDSQQLSSQRLWQLGGVYEKSIDTEKSEKLSNNYCYYNINTKILNIKLVYKLLRILFEKSDIPILCKTVVTITGKYGERGYSFTSDDYDNYSLHLTDQYFVSHASFNCTDISQRLRLQGRYSDLELKEGTMKLTLWTTAELNEIMVAFFVTFIRTIEKSIMECKNWEGVKNLLEEDIIDSETLKLNKNMKYLSQCKNMKNIQVINKRYDEKQKGYKLFNCEGMSDPEIKKCCKDINLNPEHEIVNKIEKTVSIYDFINKFGICKIKKEFREITNFTMKEINEIIDDVSVVLMNREEIDKKLGNISEKWFETRKQIYTKYNFYGEKYNSTEIKRLDKKALENSNDTYKFGKKLTDKDKEIRNGQDGTRRVFICYDGDKKYIYIAYVAKEKELPEQTFDIYKTPYCIDGNTVNYSILTKEFKKKKNENINNDKGDANGNFIEDAIPNKYFFKTPDGFLYLHDKEKPNIMKITIVTPSQKKIITIPENITEISQRNADVLSFTESYCKKTDNNKLRVALKEIFTKYEMWCKLNCKKPLKTQKKFKEELELLHFKEDTTKGVDANNNVVKRGYNILLE